jgi:hypothetical protein
LVEITLVQIEYLAQRFLKERKLSQEQLGAITIYGSSSLTLTILPNRISHDVDVAVGKDFRDFIDAVCANERPALGQLEINTANPIVLRFCGNYHQRSRKLTGSKQGELIPIEVLHPIDTLSQKLLRIPLDVFQQKDIPDIDKILRKLKPEREKHSYSCCENRSNDIQRPLLTRCAKRPGGIPAGFSEPTSLRSISEEKSSNLPSPRSRRNLNGSIYFLPRPED